MRPISERPFEHSCRFGTKFTADHCDFETGLIIHKPKDISEENFIKDIAAVIGYHAVAILPDLKRFNGYGSFDIKIVQEPEESPEEAEYRYQLGKYFSQHG